MNSSKLRKYDKEIIERYLNGESAGKIAISLGSCDNAISYRLKINGIKKRSISEATKGRVHSIAHRKKISDTRIKLKCAKGSNNPRWKGGIQDNWSKLKNSIKYSGVE